MSCYISEICLQHVIFGADAEQEYGAAGESGTAAAASHPAGAPLQAPASSGEFLQKQHIHTFLKDLSENKVAGNVIQS